MFNLSNIFEQAPTGTQFYEIGKDFSEFIKTKDYQVESLRNKYSQVIDQKLRGKRIKAKASIGYKQFVKEYEFDVHNVRIENYYDEYVVIAHGTDGKRKRDFFIITKFPVTILGQSQSNVNDSPPSVSVPTDKTITKSNVPTPEKATPATSMPSQPAPSIPLPKTQSITLQETQAASEDLAMSKKIGEKYFRDANGVKIISTKAKDNILYFKLSDSSGNIIWIFKNKLGDWFYPSNTTSGWRKISI